MDSRAARLTCGARNRRAPAPRGTDDAHREEHGPEEIMASIVDTRARLRGLTDRLPLGGSGLSVSPVCIGLVGSPDIVPAAFDAGINFFFLTADLHWPIYEHLRRGLQDLLSRGNGIRDRLIVGIVSYLDEPMFQHLQFNEVIDAVPGLERVDVLIAGAIPSAQSFSDRLTALYRARAAGYLGARSIGASFHDRATALTSLTHDAVDVHFIRYNTGHPSARHEIFPYLRPDRASRIFNFTSTFSRVTPERFRELGFEARQYWLPKPTDYYRFVLTSGHVDGLLCAPQQVSQIGALADALAEGGLTPEEERYMRWLSSVATPRLF
jgi:hypothetical protein